MEGSRQQAKEAEAQKHLCVNRLSKLGRKLRHDPQLLFLPATLQWHCEENPNVSLGRPRLNLFLTHTSVTTKAPRSTGLQSYLGQVSEGNKMYSSYLRPPTWWFFHSKGDDRPVLQELQSFTVNIHSLLMHFNDANCHSRVDLSESTGKHVVHCHPQQEHTSHDAH